MCVNFSGTICPCGAETGIFQKNQSNIKAAYAKVSMVDEDKHVLSSMRNSFPQSGPCLHVANLFENSYMI